MGEISEKTTYTIPNDNQSLIGDYDSSGQRERIACQVQTRYAGTRASSDGGSNIETVDVCVTLPDGRRYLGRGGWDGNAPA